MTSLKSVISGVKARHGYVFSPLQNAIEKLKIFKQRKKTLLIVGLAIAIPIGILYTSSLFILFKSVKKAEEHQVRQSVNEVLNTFDRTQSFFKDRFADWSAWDDTYNFIENNNKTYIQSNLIPEQIAHLKVNLLLFINSSGKIVFGRGFNLKEQKITPIPESIKRHLSPNKFLLQHSDVKSSKVGILLLPEGPMLITSQPIVTSKSKGPIRGTLIFGRYLDANLVKDLTNNFGFSVELYPISDAKMPPDLQANIANLLAKRDTTLIYTLNDKKIAGYAIINDIYDQPALILRVGIRREIYRQIQHHQRYLMTSLLIVGLVFGVTAQSLLEKLLQFQDKQVESENRYRAVVEQTSDGILLVDADRKRILEANAAYCNLLGYSPEEILTLTLYQVISEKREIIDSYIKDLLVEKQYLIGESQHLRKDGSAISVEVSCNLISYCGKDVCCILVRDITDRKQMQAELERSLSLLVATLESTADGIIALDSNGRIKSFNQKFLKMWGLPESIISWNKTQALAFINEHLKDPIAFLAIVRQYQQELEKESYDLVEFKDGRVFECYSHTQLLARKFVGRVFSFRDITKRKQAEATIQYQAFHDLLTNLPNRTMFNEQLSLALAKAEFEERVLAVMFLDIDRFKTINDTLGHAIGDRLLQDFADRVKTCLRKSDIIARWGGDEFTLVLPEITSQQDAANVGKRILDVLKTAFPLEGHALHISSSIGIAIYPQDGEDAETLLRNADAALYQAKENGRNNYQFYKPEMNAQASLLLSLENRLHQALDRNEFEVHYQPQVDIKTGQIIGMEALIRWQHPEIGLIAPGKFIPLAEENGSIVPIGEWVLRTACIQNKAWQDAGFTGLRVAVNLSPRQFQQPNIVERIAQILEETGISPQFLELEITETTLMQNVELAVKILQALQAIGVHISIDDFGTGYSSLGYLKKFHFDKLKIDQSFVRDLKDDPQDTAIISAVITLGRGLNLKVVAEGVETQEQLELLRKLQSEEMQGYLFSQPLSAEDATKFLQNPWIDTNSSFDDSCFPCSNITLSNSLI